MLRAVSVPTAIPGRRLLDFVLPCPSATPRTRLYTRNHDMLTGELRSKIDQIWNAFWAGGIANPLEVMEQITYLLFLRRLDDLHTLEENKATRLKKPIENL